MLLNPTIALSFLLSITTIFANNNSFIFSFQGNLKGLDPQSVYETFQLGTMGNLYEPLVSRDSDMNLIPALATKWQLIAPTKWRFDLRQKVSFHNGNAFIQLKMYAFLGKEPREQGYDL